MEERLQKILAQAGVGSRRHCEQIITDGRACVNDIKAILGQKADPAIDKITIDGRLIKPPDQKLYLALYKPRYVLSTVKAERGDSRQTVHDLIPFAERLYPVGRLDYDSEGLILMTNDGELANRLTHPRYRHEKEYRVLISRRPDNHQLDAWCRGIILSNGHHTAPARVWLETSFGKGAWLRVVLREGRKHQIREIGKLLGLPVIRIIRVRLGSLHLGKLKSREWRYLTPKEVSLLKAHDEI
jgi:23S rRNA pseudouridine2605 synthase